MELLPALNYLAFFLVFAGIFAVMALGLNLQWGATGLFNVGVAGFVAVGAYASALLTGPPDPARFGGFGLPVVVGWIGAMAFSGLAAAIVGVAALRLREDYLAITTFGVAVVIFPYTTLFRSPHCRFSPSAITAKIPAKTRKKAR